jgi:hypothetical protein
VLAVETPDKFSEKISIALKAAEAGDVLERLEGKRSERPKVKQASAAMLFTLC